MGKMYIIKTVLMDIKFFTSNYTPLDAIFPRTYWNTFICSTRKPRQRKKLKIILKDLSPTTCK